MIVTLELKIWSEWEGEHAVSKPFTLLWQTISSIISFIAEKDNHRLKRIEIRNVIVINSY